MLQVSPSHPAAFAAAPIVQYALSKGIRYGAVVAATKPEEAAGGPAIVVQPMPEMPHFAEYDTGVVAVDEVSNVEVENGNLLVFQLCAWLERWNEHCAEEKRNDEIRRLMLLAREKDRREAEAKAIAEFRAADRRLAALAGVKGIPTGKKAKPATSKKGR